MGVLSRSCILMALYQFCIHHSGEMEGMVHAGTAARPRSAVEATERVVHHRGKRPDTAAVGLPAHLAGPCHLSGTESTAVDKDGVIEPLQ